MREQTGHCSPEELQAKIDGRLPREDRERVDAHLAGCGECARALEGYVRIDRALRSFPLAHLDSSFTRAVMDRLPHADAAGGIFRLLVALPYLLALAIVLGTMLAVFFWGGALTESDVASTRSALDQGVDWVGGGIAVASGTVIRWVTSLVPRGAGGGGMETAAVVCGVLVLLVILDRLLVRKLFAGRSA